MKLFSLTSAEISTVKFDSSRHYVEFILIIYKVNMLSILLRELPSSHPSVSRELTLQQCRFTEHLNKQANSSLFRAELQLQNLT